MNGRRIALAAVVAAVAVFGTAEPTHDDFRVYRECSQRTGIAWTWEDGVTESIHTFNLCVSILERLGA